MNPHALMIDIETLATSPDAYVQQIGFCVGHLPTRTVLVPPTNFWTDGDQRGVTDKDTVEWWSKQDPKVKANVFSETAPRTSRHVVFARLAALAEEYDAEVWASPAMFDLPILTYYFDGKKPWDYSVERCMMTMYKLLDPDSKLAPPDNVMAHDAAADAEWQLQYLFNLHDRMDRLATLAQ